jgi:predicted nucleic acid-binding protein
VIVVDTNVLVHFTFETPESLSARALFKTDPNWYAPYLWRSEFRNALALKIRHVNLPLLEAIELARLAQEQMFDRERFVDPIAVLDLVASSTCTAYDCEFVALARELRVPLITTDKQILRDFPQVAKPLAAYS